MFFRGRLKKRGPSDIAYTVEKLEEVNTRRPYPFLYGLLSSMQHRYGHPHPYQHITQNPGGFQPHTASQGASNFTTTPSTDSKTGSISNVLPSVTGRSTCNQQNFGYVNSGAMTYLPSTSYIGEGADQCRNMPGTRPWTSRVSYNGDTEFHNNQGQKFRMAEWLPVNSVDNTRNDNKSHFSQASVYSPPNMTVWDKCDKTPYNAANSFKHPSTYCAQSTRNIAPYNKENRLNGRKVMAVFPLNASEVTTVSRHSTETVTHGTINSPVMACGPYAVNRDTSNSPTTTTSPYGDATKSNKHIVKSNMVSPQALNVTQNDGCAKDSLQQNSPLRQDLHPAHMSLNSSSDSDLVGSPSGEMQSNKRTYEHPSQSLPGKTSGFRPQLVDAESPPNITIRNQVAITMHSNFHTPQTCGQTMGTDVTLSWSGSVPANDNISYNDYFSNQCSAPSLASFRGPNSQQGFMHNQNILQYAGNGQNSIKPYYPESTPLFPGAGAKLFTNNDNVSDGFSVNIPDIAEEYSSQGLMGHPKCYNMAGPQSLGYVV